MIVADVNLVAYLLIDGPHTPFARGALNRDPAWIAPAHWRAEFVNVLATNVRGRVFTIEQAMRKLETADLLVTSSPQILEDREVIELSVQSRVATYDCGFVWLARRMGLRVVTQDGGILTNFRDVAVSIKDFAEGK